MAKILMVEDNVDLAQSVADFLTHEQYLVECVETGEDALFRLATYSYDAVILDWALPGISGLEVLRELRNSGGCIPVLLLTGKQTIENKEDGLDSGADDYLTKPFNLRELSARMRALLRRKPQMLMSTILKVGSIELNTISKEIHVKGERVHLASQDYALLELLMRYPGEIFSNDALLQRVWLAESEATSEAIRSAFKRIRKAIGDNDSTVIENIRKLGYRLNK